MRRRVYKRGRRWYVDYEDHRGSRIRKAIPEAQSKAEALEILHDLAYRESEIRRGVADPIDNTAELSCIVEGFLLNLARSPASYNTVLFYRSVLAPTIGKWELPNGQGWPPRAEVPFETLRSMPRRFVRGQMAAERVDQLTDEVLDLYLDAKSDHASVRTLNAQVAALKTMLTWARKAGKIKDSPLRDRGRFGKPASAQRVLTVEEAESLLTASPEPYQTIWLAFLTTGLRRGELVQLRWTEVDFATRTVRVLAETSTSRRQRDVPIVAELYERLVAVHGDRADPDGHVFLNRAGRPWHNNLLRRFKRCVALAGITTSDVTLHTLRHTFATHLLLRGANPKVVSELLGHASIQFTFDTYGHVLPHDKWQAVSFLPFGGTHRAQGEGSALQVAFGQQLRKATA